MNNGDTKGSIDYKKVLERSLFTIKELRAKLETKEQKKLEPIAVIGMGCRFPGGAHDPTSFWELLSDGVDAICEMPHTRWDEKAYANYHDAAYTMSTSGAARWGGFLQQPVDQFDAAFFGITPREANSMDPQQRLLLEVAWEALEHANQPIEQLAGSKTGVFVGVSGTDYALLEATTHVTVDAYVSTGNTHSVLAGRLSYFLDLRGPCVALDTACSSSLVAVHLACQSLRNFESDLALAGGVNLILSPLSTLALSYWGMLAEDGRCKTFDARANGYVRGEGCGVLVLKRLTDAQKDGDSILAVIQGSAVNQDGRSAGLTAPNPIAQEAVIRQALANARVDPAKITYVEAHGTGTQLGDPIEIDALKAVLSARSPGEPHCSIGSVKTNIGHLEAAAGVASLIKVILSLQNKQIPPHLHLKQLNTNISLEQTPLEIPTQLTPLQSIDGHRYVGVSSFGFGGTIAHMILDEAPPTKSPAQHADDDNHDYLLPLSARTSQALFSQAQNYQSVLIGLTDAHYIDNLCYTASVRRSQLLFRLAVVGKNREELEAQLRSFVRNEQNSGAISGKCSSRPPKLVFVFPGQGSQWIGMARTLMQQEPVFAQMLTDCEQMMKPYVDWSLHDLLLQAPMQEHVQLQLQDIAVLQPVLFAIEVALSALWRSWGIVPDAVIGHGMGEIAAAMVAGILSLAQAAQIICERSRLLKVDVASHGLQMEPLLPELSRRLQNLHPQEGSIPLFSTVQGTWQEGQECTAAYWSQNLRQPVRFAQSITQLVEEGFRTFLEISPHPILLAAIEENLQEQEGAFSLLASLRRDEPERASLLRSLAQLYTQGYPINWSALYPQGGQCVPLPTYPWQRQRFWLNDEVANTAKNVPVLQHVISQIPSNHPLLGQHLKTALREILFEAQLCATNPSYVEEHKVFGKIVLPVTAFIEMVIAAAYQCMGIFPYSMSDITFNAPVFLDSNGAFQSIQTILSPPTKKQEYPTKWQIFSLPVSEHAEESSWQLNAQGEIAPIEAVLDGSRVQLGELQKRCTKALDKDYYYQQLQKQGIYYGPHFQPIEQIWGGDQEALGRISLLPELQDAEAEDKYIIHPILFDACLQLVGVCLLYTMEPNSQQDRYVPTGIQRIRWYQRLPNRCWCHAVLRPSTIGEGMYDGDMTIADEHGNLIGEVYGLHIERLKQVNSVQKKITSENGKAPRDMQIANLPLAVNGKRTPFWIQLENALQQERHHLLLQRVQKIVVDIVGLTSEDELDPQIAFFDIGVDSMTAIEVRNELSKVLGCPLPANLLFEHQTVNALTENLLLTLFTVTQ